MNREFLHSLLMTPSVSGFEEVIQEKAMNYTAAFCDRQITDATGNVIHVLNPDANFKVMLMGHIDEIGFLVTHIEDDGTIKITKNGGVRPGLYIGAPVQIQHGDQTVQGVVAVTSELIKSSEVNAADLTIDIGATDAEQAKRYVSIGDPVCADTTIHELLNDNFSTRALDDRTGAFVVMEALRRAKEKGAVIGAYAATTAGEETSLRGAYWASSAVMPDLAIAVDVTFASDCPGTRPYDSGKVKLGGGPVLCTSSIVNKKVNTLLKEIASEKKIPLQWEVAAGHTGTDADKAHFVGTGIPTALVSIPLRYMHSSVEVGNYQDLEYCIELLSELLVRIDSQYSFTTLQPRI